MGCARASMNHSLLSKGIVQGLEDAKGKYTYRSGAACSWTASPNGAVQRGWCANATPPSRDLAPSLRPVLDHDGQVECIDDSIVIEIAGILACHMPVVDHTE